MQFPVCPWYTLHAAGPHTGHSDRFREVDLARGAGILLVVYFHFAFDLQHFGLVDLDWRSWQWKYQAKFIKSIFLFLVGLSLVLSFNNADKAGKSRYALLWHYARRGGMIFAVGMCITLATSIALPAGTVHFGILHAIGASLPLAYLLLPLGRWLLPLGLGIIALGFVVAGYVADGPWWIWLGILPKNYWTVDYAPMIPNFGIVLLGVVAGRWLYPDNRRRFTVPLWCTGNLMRPVCWMGRHSLIIYLAHQPALFAVFYGFNFVGLIHIGD